MFCFIFRCSIFYLVFFFLPGEEPPFLVFAPTITSPCADTLLDIRAGNVGIFPDWLSLWLWWETSCGIVSLSSSSVGKKGKGQGLDLAPHHHPPGGFLLERDILFICRDEPILRIDLIINHGVDVM